MRADRAAVDAGQRLCAERELSLVCVQPLMSHIARKQQADLAVALQVDLWPGTEGPVLPGTVSSETAILMVDAALSSRRYRDRSRLPEARVGTTS